MISVAFTGHRPEKLPFEITDENVGKLKAAMEKVVSDLSALGVKYFMSGVCHGVDLWAAEVVLSLREQYGIELWCAIPFDNHRSTVEPSQLPLYDRVLSKADKCLVLAKNIPPSQRARAYNNRNSFMVGHCDGLIAICTDGNIVAGGTKNTVEMAKAAGKSIIYIDPRKI